ncbi:MAG: hypothetical protein SH818_09865 [Saprospiraceae bacterium]|nr:hypothetical protein [Saprospiraceae bacterium]
MAPGLICSRDTSLPPWEILRKLINKNYSVLALTNWSNETFPQALELYDLLHWFEGILASGKEKMKNRILLSLILWLKGII